MAVNDAYRLALWADVLYAADAFWWQVHEGVPSFRGLKYTICPGGQPNAESFWPDVRMLRNTGEAGIETDPSGLRTARNSGAQAINLAVHLGASRIVLLGYDLGHANGQRSHFFGEQGSPFSNRSPYGTFIEFFAKMVAPLDALGIEVINCSPETSLPCFPRRSLADVFPVEPLEATA